MGRPKKEKIPDDKLVFERFKLARTKYNQHGEQSTPRVEAECGIRHSLIEDLESFSMNPPRAVDYMTVAELARHYGVCSDYLLGLDDKPTKDTNIRGIQEYTGLSAKAVESLGRVKSNPEDTGCLFILNRLLEDDDFFNILRDMFACLDTIHKTDILEWYMTESGLDSPGKPFKKVYGRGAAEYDLNNAIRKTNLMFSRMYQTEIDKLEDK